MNIIIHEMRKIFNLRIVVLAGIVSFIIYQLFINFGINYFPNGRPALDYYNISIEMLEDYGKSMNEQEFANFKGTYSEDIETANQYLASEQVFVDAGITTYQEFNNMDLENKNLEKLHSMVFFDKSIDVFWELQAKKHLIETYESNGYYLDGYYAGMPTSGKQDKRLGEVVESEGIFPELVFGYYNTFIINTAMLVLLSIMIVISPIYLKDRKNQLIHLQYASKVGRNLFKKKLIAGLLSSLIITTVQLAWLFSFFLQNNIGMFFNNNINSVFNAVFWFDLTFIQYIILTVIALYILVFVMTIITALLSRIVPNYITVIGVQVPIAFLTFVLLLNYLIGRLTGLQLPIYFAPVSYGALTVIAMLLVVMRGKREKRMDIA